MEEDCMSCLVEGCNLLLLLGDDTAALLRADTDFDEGLLDIRLHYKSTVFLRSKNCCLI